MSRGRPPLGPELAERVAVSAPAQERLKVILATIAGQMSVAAACEKLGIGEARFHELRQECLRAAAAALEPKPLGRPAAEVAPEADKIAALEREVQDLKVELRASQIREELALLTPHVLKPRKGQMDAERRARLDALQEAEKKGPSRRHHSSGDKTCTARSSGKSGNS